MVVEAAGGGAGEFLVVVGSGDGSTGGGGLELLSMVLALVFRLKHLFSRRRILRMTTPKVRRRAFRTKSAGINVQGDNALSLGESFKSLL